MHIPKELLLKFQEKATELIKLNSRIYDLHLTMYDNFMMFSKQGFSFNDSIIEWISHIEKCNNKFVNSFKDFNPSNKEKLIEGLEKICSLLENEDHDEEKDMIIKSLGADWYNTIELCLREGKKILEKLERSHEIEDEYVKTLREIHASNTQEGVAEKFSVHNEISREQLLHQHDVENLEDLGMSHRKLKDLDSATTQLFALSSGILKEIKEIDKRIEELQRYRMQARVGEVTLRLLVPSLLFCSNIQKAIDQPSEQPSAEKDKDFGDKESKPGPSL